MNTANASSGVPTSQPSNFGKGENWKGNRRGRPPIGKALTEYVRRKTNHGKRLIDFYLEVLGNEEEATQNRLIAAGRLEDRGWGKAPQQIIDSQGNGVQISFILQRFDGNAQLNEVRSIDVTASEPSESENNNRPDEAK